MVRIGICDDEKQQRGMMRRLLSRNIELWGMECVISEYGSGEELLQYITSSPGLLDIIFLDIEMGSINGVDTAREIRRRNQEVILVFVTGFSDYVFNGYEVGALNYILKPYQEEKLSQVLKQALQKLEQHEKKFLLLQSQNQIHRIPINQILYLTSDLRKVVVVTKEGMVECYGKLSDFAKELPVAFIRVHQRYLVNMAYVEVMESASLQLWGKAVPISRKYAQQAAEAFARFMLGDIEIEKTADKENVS